MNFTQKKKMVNFHKIIVNVKVASAGITLNKLLINCRDAVLHAKI